MDRVNDAEMQCKLISLLEFITLCFDLKTRQRPEV